MRALARSLLVLLMVGLAAGKLSSQTAPTRAVTAAEYESWKKDLSNWGRWGKDDQIGALNLITPAKRKEAAGLVKEGFSVSLASDADTVKAVDNPNPYEHEMLAIGNDRIGVRYHGITHTHLDSLAHINDNGVFFNGYKPDRDYLCRGPRGVGKEGGHQGIEWGRAVRAHGRVGTPEGGWAMASRPGRRGQVSRA
jgi:hypothetical protein